VSAKKLLQLSVVNCVQVLTIIIIIIIIIIAVVVVVIIIIIIIGSTALGGPRPS